MKEDIKLKKVEKTSNIKSFIVIEPGLVLTLKKNLNFNNFYLTDNFNLAIFSSTSFTALKIFCFSSLLILLPA